MTTDTFDSNTDASIENYIYDLHEDEINDKELRDVQNDHTKQIEKTLASDDWQKLMRRIHGTTGNEKRFDDDDINDVKDAYRESGRKPFEIFIKEWGTMQEWGVKDKRDKQINPAKRYPNVSDLRDLCIEIGNYAAASFINETILGGKPIQSPIINSWTERLDDIIHDVDDIVFSGDLVNEVPHEVLKHITNGFDEKKVLGEGGFSKVYKGISKSGKKLAIKNMGKAKNKCVNELICLKSSAKKYHNLIHPNIIPLYGYSNDNEDEPCLIYPCMDNGSLEKYLKEDHLKKSLNAEKRISILLGVAEAIRHMHQQTTTVNGKMRILVHQDIKPGNILLDDNLEAKVADFDLLSFAPTGNTELVTRSSNVSGGTMPYMPPEALQYGRCTAKMDIWALAVVLLQLLTGEHQLNFDESGHLIEECKERYEKSNSHAPILNILDACWKESKLTIESGNRLYNFAMNRCLIHDDKNRADIGEVLSKINEARDLIRS